MWDFIFLVFVFKENVFICYIWLDMEVIFHDIQVCFLCYYLSLSSGDLKFWMALEFWSNYFLFEWISLFLFIYLLKWVWKPWFMMCNWIWGDYIQWTENMTSYVNILLFWVISFSICQCGNEVHWFVMRKFMVGFVMAVGTINLHLMVK